MCSLSVPKKTDSPPVGSYHTSLNLPNNSSDHPVLKLSFHLSANPSITCLQSKKCVYFIHHRHPTTWGKHSVVQWMITGPLCFVCMSSDSNCWHQYTKLSHTTLLQRSSTMPYHYLTPFNILSQLLFSASWTHNKSQDHSFSVNSKK